MAERFGMAADLPSCRAMLDIEGVDGVADVVVAGAEAAVEAELKALSDAGATELIAVRFGPPDQQSRTLDLLSHLNQLSA